MCSKHASLLYGCVCLESNNRKSFESSFGKELCGPNISWFSLPKMMYKLYAVLFCSSFIIFSLFYICVRVNCMMCTHVA